MSPISTVIKMKKFLLNAVLVISSITTLNASAADKHTIKLQMNNGTFTPLSFTVPTGKIIRVEVKNIGNQPAEFESTQLRKEKVLAPGARSVVVIAPLRSGTYTFFDDFHLDQPKGMIIAIEQ